MAKFKLFEMIIKLFEVGKFTIPTKSNQETMIETYYKQICLFTFVNSVEVILNLIF